MLEAAKTKKAVIGVCIPDAVLTNHDLAGAMDVSDKWIRMMTALGRG